MLYIDLNFIHIDQIQVQKQSELLNKKLTEASTNYGQIVTEWVRRDL